MNECNGSKILVYFPLKTILQVDQLISYSLTELKTSVQIRHVYIISLDVKVEHGELIFRLAKQC